MAEILKLLKIVRKRKASDLHISVGNPPYLRVNGVLAPLENCPPLTQSQSWNLLSEILNDKQREHFKLHGDLDFSFSGDESIGRFRVNAFKDVSGVACCLRTINNETFSLDSLGFPDHVKDLAKKKYGLVLVCGAVGSGKSTTLNSLVQLINEHQQKHIITLEDPVEVIHKNIKSHVNQREMGVHSKDFPSALRAALREDPNVIVVGEIRDAETALLTLKAASSGLLVFGTVHSENTAKAVNYFINLFPSDLQNLARTILSESVQAIIAQRLLPQPNGKGRVANYEILLKNQALLASIRDNKSAQIVSVIALGKKQGMISMSEHLTQLYEKGLVAKSLHDQLQKGQEKLDEQEGEAKDQPQKRDPNGRLIRTPRPSNHISELKEEDDAASSQAENLKNSAMNMFEKLKKSS